MNKINIKIYWEMTKLQYLYNTYVSLYFTIEQKHNRALFILLILLKSTNINEMFTFIYFTITMLFRHYLYFFNNISIVWKLIEMKLKFLLIVNRNVLYTSLMYLVLNETQICLEINFILLLRYNITIGC